MAEELTTEPGTDEGQADLGSDGSQTTEAAPDLGDGQSADQTTQQGTEDTFFDPRDIADDPKLMSAYKNMQSAFTKRMQGISDQRNKIEAYDAFYANPIEQVQRVAQQYGYQLSPAQAQNIVQNEGAPNPATAGEDWQPNNWNEVMDRATQIAEKNILAKMNPVLDQVQTMRKESIESELSKIDPTWQQYEDDMRQTLQSHPTLANDPANLYRMSVPPEVLESRATQAALRKMEDRQASAQVSGKSTTSKTPGAGLPDKPVSFSDAVKAAKHSLAEQGIRRE